MDSDTFTLALLFSCIASALDSNRDALETHSDFVNVHTSSSNDDTGILSDDQATHADLLGLFGFDRGRGRRIGDR